MAAIRSNSDIAAKWATVTPQRAPDYERGVQTPLVDWKAATVAANQAWKDGIAAAAQADRFNKGVTRAGTAKWQSGAVGKGVQRWGPGVQLAQADYERAFGPFRAAIAAVTLPPRFARRDPRNLLRVQAIVTAMINTAAAQAG